MPEYTLTPDCLHIEDSYKIRARTNMYSVLSTVRFKAIEDGQDITLFSTRTSESMTEEWMAHNLLYDLHLFRSHTKDVDINNISCFWKFVYKIVSKLYRDETVITEGPVAQ